MIKGYPEICMVGAGSLSTRRIYPYIAPAGAVLTGVCDLDAQKAENNALLFGGKPYNDIDQMLAEQKPDGVIVCVGPDAHAVLAQKMIAQKIPVYTEKPPAATSKDALATARLAKEMDSLCMTAFKKRYTNAAKRAKEWLSEQNDIYSISVDYASAGYANTTKNNSFLLDFGIHAIDLVQYLMGDASRVFAFSKGANAFAVSIEFKNGAVGSLNLNDGRSFQVPTEEIEITAGNGSFMTISNSSRWRICENGKSTEWHEPPTFVSSGEGGFDTGHLPELIEFVEAIKTGKKDPPSTIYESYKSMLLYEAIEESAKTSKVLEVGYEC